MDDAHDHRGSVYGRRQIWDSKDTIPRELQFIQPLNASSDQVARIMVGPRKQIFAQDGAAQSAAANFAAQVAFSANDITPNSWSFTSLNFSVLFEHIRAAIIAADNSAKLQITMPCMLTLNGLFTLPLAPTPVSVPFIFPAFTPCSFNLVALAPMPAWLQSDLTTYNYPTATFGLVNTDGAGPHTYRRTMNFVYRPIYDVDTTKERVYVMGTLT